MGSIKQTISEISHDYCCGCSACSQVCPKHCITMIADVEGFLYPSIDSDECVKCGLCYDTCLINNISLRKPSLVYGVQAKNEIVQYTSSSGGAFTTIAQWAILHGYIVYGAVYKSDFSYVYHCAIHSMEELARIQGSKYVQSNICNTYIEVKRELLKGNKVLFSGVGCQIQGLKNFLKKEYDDLLLIDILCHGVPSPKLYEDYIKAVKYKFGPIAELNMKDKEEGWGKQHLKFLFRNPRIIIPREIADLWNNIFYSRVALRPSCYHCMFATIERCGDISLGDYWGIEEYYPKFYDNRGVSLMLINTSKGHDIIHNLKCDFRLQLTSLEQCMQPILQRPTPMAEWRRQFWYSYLRYGFEDIAYMYWRVSFHSSFYRNIKHLIKRLLNERVG